LLSPSREPTTGNTMVNVNIEIPDELHRRLKIAAVTSDTTMKQLVIELLAEDT
jgi:predicted HicB family RNase H-like nuclease